MKRERRSYDKEFKLMVVNLFQTGKSTKEVSDDLGIRPDMVRLWKREYNQYQEDSFFRTLPLSCYTSKSNKILN